MWPRSVPTWPSSEAQDLWIFGDVKTNRGYHLEFTSLTSDYHLVSYTDSITNGIWGLTNLMMGAEGELIWDDEEAGAKSAQRYYRIISRPVSQPADSDGDGIDDVFELRHSDILDPLNPDDAGAQDADGDSIGEIYKEVREARAVEDAKRGGGRGGRGGGSRSGSERRGSDGRPPRGPRPPRKDGEPASEGARVPQAVPQAAANVAEGERPARKRRRRRGGRPLEGGEAATHAAPAAPAAVPVAPKFVPASKSPAASAEASGKPSLLHRIGRGLKSLVWRGPGKH